MNRPANRRMFWRLWFRALTVKRPQAIVALVSLLVGAATISMLLNLYGDVHRKMTQEFSAYGANVILAPQDAGSTETASGERVHGIPAHNRLLDQDVLYRLSPFEQRVRGLIAVPRLDVITRVKRVPAAAGTQDRANAVAVGTNLAAIVRLNPAWRVDGRPDSGDDNVCIAGTNLAARLHARIGDGLQVEPLAPGPAGKPSEQERTVFTVSAILSTGSAEDDQVFLPLAKLQDLAALTGDMSSGGREDGIRLDGSDDGPAAKSSQAGHLSASRRPAEPKISLVEVYVPGDARQVEGVARQLAQSFDGTGVDVRPVRRIVYSQGKVLAIIVGLVIWLTSIILVIIALCVTATMTAIVLERRKDVALMKALGATNRQVVRLFLAEGAALGFAAGLAGYAIGGLLARELGRRLFGVSLDWAWWAWPVVCLATMLLALVATFLPVRSTRRVEAAVVLKGA